MKLLIFESHPVQYRAPVYQCLQELCPNEFKVIYGTDLSVSGWLDQDFGKRLAWDEPLLSGYACETLGNLAATGLGGFASLSGKGVSETIRRHRPAAVLLTQFRYSFDWSALAAAKAAGIPVWIRQETQDQAFSRPPFKELARFCFYRLLYACVDHAFYIGALNRAHLSKHGLTASRMTRAPYATVDRFKGVAPDELQAQRRAFRQKLGLDDGDWTVAFSGKFIEKKNPRLVLEAAAALRPAGGRRAAVLMIGSGSLEEPLRKRAAELARQGVKVIFTGFVNQSAIGGYYLAADALVLPSECMGETWGLVVNEALQAGCAVVVTQAVGCAAEFAGWERFRVIPTGSAAACTEALEELSRHSRSFSWCRERMLEYSIERAAEALAAKIQQLH